MEQFEVGLCRIQFAAGADCTTGFQFNPESVAAIFSEVTVPELWVRSHDMFAFILLVRH